MAYISPFKQYTNTYIYIYMLNIPALTIEAQYI
jgi:hypothetical protein